MMLAPGQTLGHYKILGPVGAGGMGEVYRATDTQLGREVAIKVLPEELGRDPDRLARFRREAQLLASLNHPNIAAIYGLEEFGGKPFLALELVEGEDLAERLTRGAIPVSEVIQIARQMAEALEEAHEKGIVHRDLKPANVKVTPEEKVKVLDFGLAKAYGGETSEGSSGGDLSLSPTMSGHMGTRAGMILGTAAYMSPEQARGKPIDRRTDIWAFGVVVYELLTARQPFGGETVSDMIAAVLTRDPDFDALPTETPLALRRLLARCLERDPRRRLRDVGEARYALQEMQASPPGTHSSPAQTGGGLPVAAQSGRGWVLGAGLLLLGLLAGVILGKLWLSEAPVPSSGSTVRFSIQPPGEVEEIWAPAVAPDGSFLVYEGHGRDKSRLFIHRLDETAPRVLQGTEGAQMPFISPDGRWVGFRQGGTLKKVPVAGGDVLTICDVPGGFPGAAWRSDGKIVFPLSWLTGLWSVSAEGGEPQLLTEPDPDQDEKGHWWPRLLPDGRNALFTIWRAKAGLNDASVAVIDLETGIYRTLFPGADAQFLPPGHIVYYRAGAYHAVPFNLRTLEVSGESVRILDDVSDLEPAGDDHMPLIVASTGLLAYTTSQIYPEARLAWVAPDQAPEFLPFPSRRYFDLDLASDGRSLLTVSLEAGSHEIRLMDIERGTEQRLDLPGSNWSPRWDPSGGSFAFLSMRKGDFDIYLLDLAGGSPEKPLLTGDMDETVEAWTPDGKRVVFTTSQPDGSNAAKAYAIGESSEPEVIFANSDFLSNLNLSGDGRWILYTGSYSGQDEVYVRSFPEAGPIVRVSRKGGRSPRWSGDGKEIIFRRGDQIVAHSFRIEGKRFVPERERVVLEAPLQNQTGPMARPDRGRMLVLLRTAEPKPPQLRVVLNWNQEVGQKAPRP